MDNWDAELVLVFVSVEECGRCVVPASLLGEGDRENEVEENALIEF